MAMQIPSNLLSEVSLQDFERRSRKISSRYHKATLRAEEGRDTGRQECDQNRRYAPGAEAVVLGWAKGDCVSSVRLDEEQIRKDQSMDQFKLW